MRNGVGVIEVENRMLPTTNPATALIADCMLEAWNSLYFYDCELLAWITALVPGRVNVAVAKPNEEVCPFGKTLDELVAATTDDVVE